MRTISFINLKGGVGKTVSAANFAHILAAIHNKRVLLVDGDKQGNASQYFRLYGEQDGLAALLLNPEQDILESIYTTRYRGLDVITSNMDLYTADREIYGDEGRDTARTLKSILHQPEMDYDYCVIDNGPSIDTVALNVLVASNDVLIPIRPDDFSFSGLVDLAEQVESAKALNPGLSLRGRNWRKAGFAPYSKRLSPTIPEYPKARLRTNRFVSSPDEAGRRSSIKNWSRNI